MTTFGQLASAGVLEYSDGYRTKKDELAEDGFRILRVADVHDGWIGSDGQDFVDSHYESKVGQKFAREGDILLTTKGTIGRIAVVPDLAGERLVYSPQLCYFRVRNSDVLDASYLRYWLASPNATRQIGALSSSTDMAPYLSLRDIRTLQIDLPGLPVQRAISDVLGALDDKITANRTVGSRLRDLQAALWVKEARTLPRAALIELAPPKLGGTPSRSNPDLWGGGVPWASVRDMTAADFGVVLSTAETIAANSGQPDRLRPVPAGTVYITARGTVGRVATAGVDCAFNQSAYAFVPPPGKSAALRLAIEGAVADLVARAHGSVFSTITTSTLADVVVPDICNVAATEMTRKLEMLEGRVLAALKENVVLARTRDDLLPLLMNGRITVKDAEKVAENVL